MKSHGSGSLRECRGGISVIQPRAVFRWRRLPRCSRSKVFRLAPRDAFRLLRLRFTISASIYFAVRFSVFMDYWARAGTELLESIAGARTIYAGAARLNGKDVNLSSVSNAGRQGIALVPEDRQKDGLFPDMSIRENIAIGSLHGMFISRKEQLARVRALVDELGIVARNLELPVTALSGGNQQKVLIARCLMRNPSLLLLDEPTRGVDVGAKEEIYQILRKLAARGIGILFTSSEIEETRALADEPWFSARAEYHRSFQAAR